MHASSSAFPPSPPFCHHSGPQAQPTKPKLAPCMALCGSLGGVPHPQPRSGGCGIICCRSGGQPAAGAGWGWPISRAASSGRRDRLRSGPPLPGGAGAGGSGGHCVLAPAGRLPADPHARRQRWQAAFRAAAARSCGGRGCRRCSWAGGKRWGRGSADVGASTAEHGASRSDALQVVAAAAVRQLGLWAASQGLGEAGSSACGKAPALVLDALSCCGVAEVTSSKLREAVVGAADASDASFEVLAGRPGGCAV